MVIMDWLKNNALALIIAIVGVIASYSVNTALYGYRLGAVEARQDRQGTAIQTLQSGDTETKVALAKIQTSLEYIQAQLARIVP